MEFPNEIKEAIERNLFTYKYGHSYCRFVVNDLTAIAIARMGPNPKFADCGSKYHLLEKMLLDKDY